MPRHGPVDVPQRCQVRLATLNALSLMFHRLLTSPAAHAGPRCRRGRPWPLGQELTRAASLQHHLDLPTPCRGYRRRRLEGRLERRQAARARMALSSQRDRSALVRSNRSSIAKTHPGSLTRPVHGTNLSTSVRPFPARPVWRPRHAVSPLPAREAAAGEVLPRV